MDPITSVLHALVPDASPTARKLFSVIVQQVEHGPIRFKSPGVATPPEILEACGLDVGEFYELLSMLAAGGAIEVSGAYPFEEIRLTPEVRARLAPPGEPPL
jgi:hypothetical protein